MTISIPLSMHAWRKHKGNPSPVWEEVPVPGVPRRGFLVKLLASGVCHSDQALLDVEDRPHFNEKYTLGHEGCGEIIAIGEDVNDSRFRLGTRIACVAVPGCGAKSCSECSRGLDQLCPNGQHHGIGQDGFYAPYVAIDARGAVLVPEGVPSAVAAVATDAVNTAYHGIVRRAEVKKEETVFLFGLGGLGFNALQVVRYIGARVIVSDLRSEKLELAVQKGVPREDVVSVGNGIPEFVVDNGLQGKIDTVLDFVGSHQTFHDAQQIVRPGGKILCVGTHHRQNEVDMKIGIRKRLSIIFTYGGLPEDLVAVLDLIAKGTIQPRVETKTLPEMPTVLKDLCAGKIQDRVALIS
ncbi:alcohol dehydrogenase [Aspergillus campestris IBT 28561]|uniref:Alcohol dehydrogenase n=1 Tax=Aspergillus campestris (strain IBT 28561) TaxID=1392248 RepID=A0A2I1D4T7_ASPC2|nr:alcohol dehydrogenase [Aspergillus campestris IBT 28561]PKY04901.1 alcohol dehydrogenase [Aspergillus campestris IBT 28561]